MYVRVRVRVRVRRRFKSAKTGAEIANANALLVDAAAGDTIDWKSFGARDDLDLQPAGTASISADDQQGHMQGTGGDDDHAPSSPSSPSLSSSSLSPTVVKDSSTCAPPAGAPIDLPEFDYLPNASTVLAFMTSE